MKVSEFAEKLGLEVLAMPSPDVEVTGGFTCDLLSWVIGRAETGGVWITIMTNINVVAVALLVGVSAIVIADGADIRDDVIKKACEEEINILRCDMTAYNASAAIKKLIGV